MNPLQFQVPHQSEPQVEPEVVSQLDPEQYDAEFLKKVEAIYESRYKFIKDMEKDISRRRSEAGEDSLPKQSMADRALEGVMNVFSKIKAPMSLDDKLVEAESKIGGELLPTNPDVIRQRFWFHGGDWFYEVHDSKGPMVARYQFDDDFSYKLVDGKEVEFAEGEEARLIELVGLYYEQIKLQLYPDKSKSDYDLAA